MQMYITMASFSLKRLQYNRCRTFRKGFHPAVIQNRTFHQVTGDTLCPSQVMGLDQLRDPRLNKGLAFTIEERQALGIHGLMPARVKTQEEQMEMCKVSIMSYEKSINKYLYLSDLHDRNEKLFFRFLAENVKMALPIVSSPTVGLACQKYGVIFRWPRGLFITINDRGHCFDLLKNWAEPNIRTIVVTDGERVLGLGDIGATGMPVAVGKVVMCTALAGIKPNQCLPITLDVGINNEALLKDPLYVGLRQKRTVGPEYDDFIDEFLRAVVKRYGQDTLIQFEDFGDVNAMRFLQKYRNRYCVFNDDIQGTACATVAGILTSKRITRKKISDNTFVFLGAGETATDIADLLVAAMKSEGTCFKDARDKIWLFDINGLLTKNRPEEIMNPYQAVYAKEHAPVDAFTQLVEEVKPTVLIGASAKTGAFTPHILSVMAKYNKHPLIFTLTTPTSKAECTAKEAYTNTDGRAIYSSSSSFHETEHAGKVYQPGQGNNAYVFPGIVLGVIAARMNHVSDEVFLVAARALAELVQDEDLARGCLYPPHTDILQCSIAIATKILAHGYSNGTSRVYPEPRDLRAYVESQLYDFNYQPSLPVLYKYKKIPHIVTKPLEDVTVAKKTVANTAF